MEWSRLRGEQYVRLTPEAAEAIAPYVRVAAEQIEELALDLDYWPEEIDPSPLRGRDGRLIAGDPLLIHASEAGLLFAPGRGSGPPVPVRWESVKQLRVLAQRAATA